MVRWTPSLRSQCFLRSTKLGQSDEFVGAALPRWRWLAIALAGRGSAARYEGVVFCVTQSLANNVNLRKRHRCDGVGWW